MPMIEESVVEDDDTGSVGVAGTGTLGAPQIQVVFVAIRRDWQWLPRIVPMTTALSKIQTVLKSLGTVLKSAATGPEVVLKPAATGTEVALKPTAIGPEVVLTPAATVPEVVFLPPFSSGYH